MTRNTPKRRGDDLEEDVEPKSVKGTPRKMRFPRAEYCLNITSKRVPQMHI